MEYFPVAKRQTLGPVSQSTSASNAVVTSSSTAVVASSSLALFTPASPTTLQNISTTVLHPLPAITAAFPGLFSENLTTITYWTTQGQIFKSKDTLSFHSGTTLGTQHTLTVVGFNITIPARKEATKLVTATAISSVSLTTTKSLSSSTSSITTSSTTTSTTSSPQATSTTSSTPTATPNAATSTPSSTPAVATVTKTNAGATAGAAIAGLVVGAIIAALLVCIFMRRKQKKQNRERQSYEKRLGGSNNSSSRSNTDPSAAPLIGAGAGAAGAGAAGLAGVAAWERHLPQSEADSTIRSAVQATLTQIDLHVDNYYRDAHVPMTPELQSELMGLKLDGHLPDSIIGLLPQTRSPTQLIKHCLAQLIVSRTSLDEGGEPKESFLPPDFTALSTAIGREKVNSSKPAFSPALSKHRVLTNYLRPTPRTDRAYLSHRENRIAAAADSFSSAFAPWAKPSHPPDARRAHLISVMKAAADTGIMLFAQPSTFRYVWDMPKRDEGRAGGPGIRGDGAGAGALRVVVLPGFVKVGDEGAKVLERPQQLVEPVVGSLT